MASSSQASARRPPTLAPNLHHDRPRILPLFVAQPDGSTLLATGGRTKITQMQAYPALTLHMTGQQGVGLDLACEAITHLARASQPVQDPYSNTELDPAYFAAGSPITLFNGLHPTNSNRLGCFWYDYQIDLRPDDPHPNDYSWRHLSSTRIERMMDALLNVSRMPGSVTDTNQQGHTRYWLPLHWSISDINRYMHDFVCPEDYSWTHPEQWPSPRDLDMDRGEHDWYWCYKTESGVELRDRIVCGLVELKCHTVHRATPPSVTRSGLDQRYFFNGSPIVPQLAPHPYSRDGREGWFWTDVQIHHCIDRDSVAYRGLDETGRRYLRLALRLFPRLHGITSVLHVGHYRSRKRFWFPMHWTADDINHWVRWCEPPTPEYLILSRAEYLQLEDERRSPPQANLPRPSIFRQTPLQRAIANLQIRERLVRSAVAPASAAHADDAVLTRDSDPGLEDLSELFTPD
jgi:hypothetical protein